MAKAIAHNNEVEADYNHAARALAEQQQTATDTLTELQRGDGQGSFVCSPLRDDEMDVAE